MGIAKVSSEDELGPALDAAFAHDSLVIVEAFSAGLEVECSVLGNGSPEASEPGEIAIDADWYDYEAKYRPGGMELVIPARVSAEDREKVRELAVALVRAHRLRGPGPGGLLRRARAAGCSSTS